MKWLIYVVIFVYFFYRTVYGDNLVISTRNNGDYLLVGEQGSIICQPAYKNQKVEWVYPNETVVQRMARGRIFAQEHFVSRTKAPELVLTIMSAVVSDSGVYQCRSGDVTKDFSLCVIEPAEFIKTPDEVTIGIGRSITLICQSKGDPEPRLAWYKNGEIIEDEDTSGKYKVSTRYSMEGFEGQLTITSLTADDSGTYTCTSIQESVQVDNCTHTETKNITLHVKYAPTFEDEEETFVYGKLNKIVQLECRASGYPLPTFKWYKEQPDSLFQYDQKQIELSEDGDVAMLDILLTPATSGQRFKCEVENDQGKSEKYFTVMKTEKPKRMEKVIQINSTHDTVELTVLWDENIMFPIDEFIVQYVQDDDEDNRGSYLTDASWKKIKHFEMNMRGEEVTRSPLLTVISTSVPDLEAETSYWLRLRASNEAGFSPWSEPVFITTESEEVTPEATEQTNDETDEAEDGNVSDGSFYGIFFAGGILVVAFVCMFAMRLVK